MGDEAFWDNLWGLVWNPVSWAQVLLLVLAMPLWFPIVRALWRELQEVFAPLGGVYGLRAPRPIRDRVPGEDPFAKIPLASYRRAGNSDLIPQARGPARRAARHTAVRSSEPRGSRRPTFRSPV